MINCSIVMRPNPLKKEEPKKAYACVQTSKKMNINQFAEHISSHGCVYSRADIAAILTMAVDCMRENLLDGVLIKLGDLGDFEKYRGGNSRRLQNRHPYRGGLGKLDSRRAFRQFVE